MQAAVKDILRESKILTLSAAKHHIIISYLTAQFIYECAMPWSGPVHRDINRQEVNGLVIINVCHHKTVTAKGPAKVVATDSPIIQLLDDY